MALLDILFGGRKKETNIQVLLQRPDGLYESLGYDLPSQIDLHAELLP